jgi:hypothetical protein
MLCRSVRATAFLVCPNSNRLLKSRHKSDLGGPILLDKKFLKKLLTRGFYLCYRHIKFVAETSQEMVAGCATPGCVI